MKDEFDLNAQYAGYLKLIKLDEKRMAPNQNQETKRAYFAACGKIQAKRVL